MRNKKSEYLVACKATKVFAIRKMKTQFKGLVIRYRGWAGEKVGWATIFMLSKNGGPQKIVHHIRGGLIKP
jgi:hypothetical protein